jgi:hypothetical protein
MAFGQIYRVSYFGEVNDSAFGAIYPLFIRGRKIFIDTLRILTDTLGITTDKITI